MKQPFILTLVSSVACAVTAANKAPENTTPTKSKTLNKYLSKYITNIYKESRESFSPMLMQQPPPAPLPATPC